MKRSFTRPTYPRDCDLDDSDQLELVRDFRLPADVEPPPQIQLSSALLPSLPVAPPQSSPPRQNSFPPQSSPQLASEPSMQSNIPSSLSSPFQSCFATAGMPLDCVDMVSGAFEYVGRHNEELDQLRRRFLKDRDGELVRDQQVSGSPRRPTRRKPR